MPFPDHPLPLRLPLLLAFVAVLAIGCSVPGCSMNSVMRRMRRVGIGRG